MAAREQDRAVAELPLLVPAEDAWRYQLAQLFDQQHDTCDQDHDCPVSEGQWHCTEQPLERRGIDDHHLKGNGQQYASQEEAVAEQPQLEK